MRPFQALATLKLLNPYIHQACPYSFPSGRSLLLMSVHRLITVATTHNFLDLHGRAGSDETRDRPKQSA